jgi:hypothetical protein
MKMPCTLQPQCNFLRSGLDTSLLSLRAGRASVAFKSQDAHLGAPPGVCFATVAFQPSILVTCTCAVVRANHCTRRHTCSCSSRSRCARRRRRASSHNRPRNRWEGGSQHGAIGGTTEGRPCLSDPPRHKTEVCPHACIHPLFAEVVPIVYLGCQRLDEVSSLRALPAHGIEFDQETVCVARINLCTVQ